MSEQSPWLTRSGLSERWQIPVQTLANWASQGRGPRVAHFGKHVRYHINDVIAWENEQFGEAS